jgi:uncharacterized protein (TIGR03118 family)
MNLKTALSQSLADDPSDGAPWVLALDALHFLRASDAMHVRAAHRILRNEFSQSNLVADSQPGHVNAQLLDANLINPWGIAFSPTGAFWVANNHTGTATVYSVNPANDTATAVPLVVTIAPPTGQTFTASPTGTVFNSDPNPGFMVGGSPATFIFATEDGTISAWNGGMQTTLEVDYSNNPAHGDPSVPPDEGIGAVYKGLAMGTDTSTDTTLLFATNFRHGTVDVFNDQWQQVMSLTDGSLPVGYAPFGAQVLDGHLFVTFAMQDQFKHDDVSGAGHGFVDEFNLSGQLVSRVVSGGELNSPWGLAIAPSDFGKFSGDLLVGNFGDGTIDAYDLNHGDRFVGKLPGIDGNPVTIGDLWALTPGNDGQAGSSDRIYFTAGIQGESFGLFGSLAHVPNSDRFMVTGADPHAMIG